jgi:hypothetical protein
VKSKKPGKIRNAQRQRISQKFVIAVGTSILLMTGGLLIYFQISQTSETKAQKTETLTPGQLPVELNVEQQVHINADTLMREGVRYKIAKPLTKTSAR